MKPVIPANEVDRLAALDEYQILDTFPEKEYDDITLLASYISQSPIALISLIDNDRQWFKSKVGLDTPQTSRDHAFCAHAIHGNEIMVVKDAMKDHRFKSNPLVNGHPNIRFYAGSPLITPSGYKLGTLCVIDNQPRTISDKQTRALEALSRQVMSLLELRRLTTELEQTNQKQAGLIAELEAASKHIKQLEGFIPICANCKNVRDDKGYWEQVESYVKRHSGAEFTHSICPKCAKMLYPELDNFEGE